MVAVLLLLNSQSLSADAWHFLRRTMDRVDSVKFILCCDGYLRWMVEGFGKYSRQVIEVESPSKEEVMLALTCIDCLCVVAKAAQNMIPFDMPVDASKSSISVHR